MWVLLSEPGFSTDDVVYVLVWPMLSLFSVYFSPVVVVVVV